MTTCHHTPSRHRTLAARFLDHFLNGETPHAEDDRVLCAKCGAELSHPEAYLHPAVRIACLCSSTAAGLAALWMLQGLVQAQWSYLPSVILTLAAAVVTALILERAVVSFVLAAFPWERIEAAPEDLCLHRSNISVYIPGHLKITVHRLSDGYPTIDYLRIHPFIDGNFHSLDRSLHP